MSNLIKVVKSESTKWIKENNLVNGSFGWQPGYGAFSYSHSHIERVYHYIKNQKKHHQKKTFREEYIELLENFNIDYDERYVFKEINF